MKVEIAGLWISPGHNFFGRHGEKALNHPALAVDEMECVAGRGIRRDRFFDFRPDYKGQITFVALEMLERVQQILKLDQIPPGATRRNVHTRGVNLNELIGITFELDGVRFQGAEECRPCEWMNEAIAPGAEDLMRGHGGLRAKILSDGVLKRTTAATLRIIGD